MSTVFEKIIAGELPAEKVYESETLIAIHDIAPVAPVHLLIITKKVIHSLHEMAEEDTPLLAEVVRVAQTLARQFGVADSYRLITNSGVDAGQTVFHLHFHLVGGRPLGAFA
jgi:diadenosine tetraphosphate (Ap4A) HIT family hydrolase